MKEGLQKNINKAVTAIRKADKVLIACHVNPDGDTIGCQLALGLSLVLLGKRVILVSQDGVPTRFQFLPGSELILSGTTETADVSIAVDCGSDERLGNVQTAFFKAKTTIQVDHHDFGESFGKIQVLEEEASAVGEIVYELIRALKVEITPAIATCLLTSIIVDTGSFRFSNIRPETFEICGKLIRKGVDLQHLIEQSYWKQSRAAARLTGQCVMNSEYSDDGKIAWSTVYMKDFKKYGAKVSDVDPVADDMRFIEGVVIAALFRETPKKKFRVSLRSSHGINVAQVAKHFNGGGHHNAAGCLIPGTAKAKQKVLDQLAQLL